jgi:ATP-dependent DNA ligase
VTSPGGALDGERITACYPEVVTALEELLGDRSCIVDGEIVALDPLGGRRYSR